jgi:putative ABC transport system permease protein
MRIKETFKTALESLSLNKFRSFLTMLGVIIGVFSVVTLISLVKGVQNYIEDQFKLLGSNTVFILPGKIGSAGGGGGSPGAFTGSFEERDVSSVRIYAKDYIDMVTPVIATSRDIKYKTKSYFSTIHATNYQGDAVFNFSFKFGRYLNRLEENTKSRVIILGDSINNELFSGRDSVGQNVKVDGKNYQIIGVLNPKGSDYDQSGFVPYTTVLKEFPDSKISTMAAKVKGSVSIDTAVEQIKLALLKNLKNDQFSVLTQSDFLTSINSILNIITIALAAIAGISLFVGGIGIMNIELVSVTERTREIGLRKALGATSRNIKLQFLTEAVFISVVGGVIGLIFGWLVTFLVRNLIRAQIPLWSVFLSLGFSILVGIVFGTYPAIKASKKDPIEALRYE